jgi:hypothetical protein
MTEVAEQASAEETQVATETVSYVGEGGILNEGWMEGLGVHEDLRNDLTLKSTKNVAGLASQLVNAQKMIGKNMTSLPNADSTDVEWDAFKDNFRPATAGDYTFEHIEGMEVNEEFETSIKEFAHQKGWRQEDVQDLIALDDARIAGMKDAIAQAEAQKMTDAETALKKEWGGAYEERLHLANRMINDNVSEENKAAILEQVGNNPVIANFLADIAAKFVEHKIIDASITKSTPMDAIAKAEELMHTAGYITGELAKTSPARHKQITEEIAALNAEAYPE